MIFHIFSCSLYADIEGESLVHGLKYIAELAKLAKDKDLMLQILEPILDMSESLLYSFETMNTNGLDLILSTLSYFFDVLSLILSFLLKGKETNEKLEQKLSKFTQVLGRFYDSFVAFVSNSPQIDAEYTNVGCLVKSIYMCSEQLVLLDYRLFTVIKSRILLKFSMTVYGSSPLKSGNIKVFASVLASLSKR